MPQIKIATFNVNSVKARMVSLLNWLKTEQPHIVCLQELKCENLSFPVAELEDLGYNIAVNGQKTYNGVAVLSKFKIQEVVCTKLPTLANSQLPTDFNQNQARYLEVLINIYGYVARVASVYSPNGGDNLLPGQHFSSTNKFCYKLEFLQSLKNHWQQNIKYNQELQILAGDFNVAHTSFDIHNPQTEQLLFSAPEKLALQSLLNLPLLDAYRTLNPNKTEFSWWNYQASAFSKNLGARIDYILVSSFTADFLTASYHHINQTRAVEKPSDHCAVLAEIKI